MPEQPARAGCGPPIARCCPLGTWPNQGNRRTGGGGFKGATGEAGCGRSAQTILRHARMFGWHPSQGSPSGAHRFGSAAPRGGLTFKPLHASKVFAMETSVPMIAWHSALRLSTAVLLAKERVYVRFSVCMAVGQGAGVAHGQSAPIRDQFLRYFDPVLETAHAEAPGGYLPSVSSEAREVDAYSSHRAGGSPSLGRGASFRIFNVSDGASRRRRDDRETSTRYFLGHTGYSGDRKMTG